MKIKYEINALPIKLTKEMETINERHRILYYDGYVEVELFDIRVVNVIQHNDITNEIDILNSYYERRTFEEQIDEEGNKHIVENWNIDETFSMNKIDSIIQNHDPSPLELEPSTDEILDDLIVNLVNKGLIY